MTRDEAKKLLLMHSFMSEDIEHPKMTTGFLGSLRPYKGLQENNFHEVIAVLRVLAPELCRETVDTQIVSALWGMCKLARAWGVHPQGMLRSNNLIADRDAERLEDWVDAIEYAVMILLESNDMDEAFAPYRSVVEGN